MRKVRTGKRREFMLGFKLINGGAEIQVSGLQRNDSANPSPSALELL